MKLYSEKENRMRVKFSTIAVSAIMLMKKATGILKRTMFVAFVFAGCIGISTIGWAGFSEADYRTVAENFLLYQNSSKQIISTDSVKDNDRIIGYIMGLEGGGYILIPATTVLPPVKAYSLKSDFNNLPPAYKAFLIEELKFFQNERRISTRDSEQTENNDSWNFLLSYKDMKVFPRYTPNTFLLKTKWNQGYPYNKMLPEINGEKVVTGCTQTAWAQIMKYHAYPATFKGLESYTWEGETQTQVLTILPNKSYHWENMPDVADSSVAEYKQDEVALLMRDLGIVNQADFGVGGTSAGTNRIGIIEHFGYSNQMSDMRNDNPEFFTVLKGEIDNNRPVFLSFVGIHATVADGYNEGPIGKNFHINMGWGGSDDNFYYLNGTSADGFDTTPPHVSMTYNIKPCSSVNNDCYETLSAPETADSINGSISSGQYTISGQFNNADDIDTYSVYLKGTTNISGNRGYSNQAFYISVYNSKYELIISSNNPISSYLFPADKYFIKVSLGGYFYDSYIAYTVNISTQPITDTEKAEIDSRDTPPVINNDFKTLGIKEVYQIRVDSGDVNGDTVSLSAASSNENLTVSVDKDVLTITPQVSSGYSEITIKAAADGKQTTKSFSVFITDTPFGKKFMISDIFASQNDFNKHKVIMDGSCSITGYRGYGNQAFYTSVMDLSSNYIVNMTDQKIQSTFPRGSYLIGASLQGYSYQQNDHDSYTLTVSCPNADDSVATIANLLGIPITASRVINLNGNLAFENVQVNAKKTLTFTISNTGNSPLTVSSITYPAGFTGNWNSGTIAAGGSQNVTVTFAPTAAQTYSGTVTVNSDKTGGTNTLAISGTGIPLNDFSVLIFGASSISENSYSDYKLTATYPDKTTQDVTASAIWTENSAYASLDTSVKGRLKTATVSLKQTVTLTAKYTYNGVIKTASMPITIEPKVLSLVTVTGASSIKGGSYGDYKATALFADGTTQDITASAVWAENSTYASMDYLTKGRLKTSVVRAEQKVTLTARYTYKGVAKTASVAVTITVPPALKGLSITGSSGVNEKSYGDYTATATFDDGSTQDVTASSTWTDNSAYAYMDSAKKGRLRTASVSSDQAVTVTARYTFNGLTKTALFPVTIINIP
jgi:hypothetical protein